MASTVEVAGEIRCQDCERLLLVAPVVLPASAEEAYRLGRQHGMVLHSHTCTTEDDKEAS